MTHGQIAEKIRRLKEELEQARQMEKAAILHRRQVAAKLKAFIDSLEPELLTQIWPATHFRGDGLFFGLDTSKEYIQVDPGSIIKWLKEHAPQYLKTTIRWTRLKPAIKKGLAVPGVTQQDRRRFFVRVY